MPTSARQPPSSLRAAETVRADAVTLTAVTPAGARAPTRTPAPGAQARAERVGTIDGATSGSGAPGACATSNATKRFTASTRHQSSADAGAAGWDALYVPHCSVNCTVTVMMTDVGSPFSRVGVKIH